jgi:hypothetical protein
MSIERLFLWASLLLCGALLAYLAHAATRSWLVGVPSDYFIRGPAHPSSTFAHVTRMIVGGLLIVMGIIMLVTPGPGIITILVGLLVTDGGGKHALVRRVMRSPRVVAAVDAIRRRSGQPPLVMP